mgnify:CR=1 FL=1
MWFISLNSLQFRCYDMAFGSESAFYIYYYVHFSVGKIDAVQTMVLDLLEKELKKKILHFSKDN